MIKTVLISAAAIIAGLYIYDNFLSQYAQPAASGNSGT